MSGHSKWANIRVKKTAQDSKRGKVFTRHARLIEIAAKGGGDPVMNPTLRTVIENAKEDSVPNANIERAIKKGTGELKGEQMQEMIFEAYGPAGTAYIVECLSDNRNRTVANVKNVISKNGGHNAENNAVGWMFERKGLVIADLPQPTPSQERIDELELAAIDFGAEEFEAHEGMLRVVTAIGDWTQLRDFLKKNSCKIVSAGLSYIPKQRVALADEAAVKRVSDFIELIEEDEDVSQVHTNADV